MTKSKVFCVVGTLWALAGTIWADTGIHIAALSGGEAVRSKGIVGQEVNHG